MRVSDSTIPAMIDTKKLTRTAKTMRMNMMGIKMLMFHCSTHLHCPKHKYHLTVEDRKKLEKLLKGMTVEDLLDLTEGMLVQCWEAQKEVMIKISSKEKKEK